VRSGQQGLRSSPATFLVVKKVHSEGLRQEPAMSADIPQIRRVFFAELSLSPALPRPGLLCLDP
jgi:hypothetical protein